MTDALTAGFLSDSSEDVIDATSTEALEFLLNLMSNREVYAQVLSKMIGKDKLE